MPMYRVSTTIVGPAASGGGYNELYFAATGGDAAAAHDAAADFWEAVGVLALSTNTFTTLGDVETVDEITGNITGVTSVTPRVKVGQNTGDPVPKSTNALIRLRTGNFEGGREVRGRIFVPGLTEGQSDAGGLLASTRTALQTAADAMRTHAGSTLVVYSRTHHKYASVASCNVWSEWAVLRSRRD